MKEPKVELKKISFYERMSEETNCFVADLYINGKKVGEVKNDGQGGCTNYRGFTKENNEIIRQAEEYFNTLPKVKSEYGFTYQPSLENEIDDQLEQYLKAKAEKKMQKLMETAIIIGKPNGSGYSYIKQGRKLSEIPVNILQPHIDKLKAKYCKDGVVILNTNLKELGIN
jgi:hypothetical protein